jgi:hypothetical protein
MNIDHNEELRQARENLANDNYENLLGQGFFRNRSVEDVPERVSEPQGQATEAGTARGLSKEKYLSVVGASPNSAIALTIWNALSREGYKIVRQ